MNASFGDFFQAVWGREPYPWQVRLAETVVEVGWPALLDLPTGSGKTAALDVALWHLARDGGRTAPRRVVLVVDRRVIVDQVGERVAVLRDALRRRAHPATIAVADALRAIVGADPDGPDPDAPLIETAVLRGASLRDDAWAKRPHVPVLASSTVDQVGSRLLFRGYGVSDSMRPIHAGLLGCDTLILLDEVHLAHAFADVLGQLASLRGEEGVVPRRFVVVQLSATPGPGATAFRLLPEDRVQGLTERLSAQKAALLEMVKVRATLPDMVKRQALAEKAATHARKMFGEGRRAIAVVVNRVDTARRVWAELDGTIDADVVLLTGRMRPLDQASVLDQVRSRVLADRTDDPAARPVVVVATQCIEAGADFDFDGLVTECAALDALRQRFGRLDRKGVTPSRAVILVRDDQLKSADAVYGTALANTWRWLQGLAPEHIVDLGIDALQPALDLLGDGIDSLRAPRPEAPVVLPAYIEQWVQTNPRPQADPDVALFLHGIPEDARSTVPDVQVVWRADVTRDRLLASKAGGDPLSRLVATVSVAPPGSLEALALAPWTLAAWLAHAKGASDVDGDLADVDGQRPIEPTTEASSELVLVWDGPDSRVDFAHNVEAGAVVVVPAECGGLGSHRTFDPEERTLVVSDLGDAVQLLQRGRPMLRLDGRVLGAERGRRAEAVLADTNDEHDLNATRDDALASVVNNVDESDPAWLIATKSALTTGAVRWIALPSEDGLTRWAVVRRLLLTPADLAGLLGQGRGRGESVSEVTTGGDADEAGSFTGASIELDDHLRGVGAMAEEFARRCTLPAALVVALRWAGRIHDIGKADPRFQLWLYGGDQIDATGAPLLAKSAVPARDAVQRRRARARAGYAPGQRHELVSLDMAERSEALRTAVERDGADWDLVLHLVASHHGWCRPLAPAADIPDADADEVTLDVDGIALTGTTRHRRGSLASGVADRFWALVRMYGAHELAYLEAILRLADHRRSAQEQAAAVHQ